MMRKMGMGALLTLMTMGCADSRETPSSTKLYMDVHELGSVSAADVAEAHQKDLAAQAKHRVSFKAYWVDEEHGKVYCLAEAPDPDSVVATHREAHGLLPTWIGQVTEGR